MYTPTYKVFTEQEGLNHVKVFKFDGNRYVNDWNFTLKGDDEPIIFKEFYTESRFAIINWDGWIRLYDASIKTTLVDHKLNGKVDASAVLSLDKTKLYVAYTDDSNNSQLVIFDLTTYELYAVELPDIYKDSIKIRKDGCLLFYKDDYKQLDGNRVFIHFYSVLNLETKKLDQFELPFAAQFPFGEFKPVVDIEKNRVIMPLYDDVTNKTNTIGEIVFEYRIVLFDLTTFERTHSLSVRDFPINQLACNENDGTEMAAIFMAPDRNKDYTEMQRDFFENLTTIKIVEDGMWLCWRGGIVRKVRSDFSLSPLLATTTRPQNSTEGMFNHAYFHSHLYHADNTSLVFAEDLNFSKTAIPNMDDADLETPIPLILEPTSLDELYNLMYSNENIKEIEQRDFIQINVSDLSTKESMIDALDQIEIVVSDLKAAGIGKLLRFTFSDKKENTKEEKTFFIEAAAIAPDQIQQILEKLMANNSIKYLYRNEEETVLCYAVFELAHKGESYLNTVINYLNAIEDPDYNQFIRENVIQYIETTYSVAVIKEKIKTISTDLAQWYEYYREEADL